MKAYQGAYVKMGGLWVHVGYISSPGRFIQTAIQFTDLQARGKPLKTNAMWYSRTDTLPLRLDTLKVEIAEQKSKRAFQRLEGGCAVMRSIGS
jgi:hypothetical protein